MHVDAERFKVANDIAYKYQRKRLFGGGLSLGDVIKLRQDIYDALADTVERDIRRKNTEANDRYIQEKIAEYRERLHPGTSVRIAGSDIAFHVAESVRCEWGNFSVRVGWMTPDGRYCTEAVHPDILVGPKVRTAATSGRL